MRIERRHAPRAALWMALLGLHLAVLSGLSGPKGPRPDPAADASRRAGDRASGRQVIRLTLLTGQRPGARPSHAEAAPLPRPPARAALADSLPRPGTARRPLPAAEQATDPSTDHPLSNAPAGTGSAGSAQAQDPLAEHPAADVGLPPTGGRSLLTSEATRRAIRQAAAAPMLSERAASASNDPGRETSQQRLGREVAATANGNCETGEYAGSGLGLLSLPFYLAARAGGKCRK